MNLVAQPPFRANAEAVGTVTSRSSTRDRREVGQCRCKTMRAPASARRVQQIDRSIVANAARAQGALAKIRKKGFLPDPSFPTMRTPVPRTGLNQYRRATAIPAFQRYRPKTLRGTKTTGAILLKDYTDVSIFRPRRCVSGPLGDAIQNERFGGPTGWQRKIREPCRPPVGCPNPEIDSDEGVLARNLFDSN